METNQKDIIKYDQELFEQLQQSQFYKNKRISYGTSGFRFNHELLPFVCYRVGIFSSLLTKTYNNETMGIVFTASHNPAQDNGVKMIRNNCEMLFLSEEKILEDFVNEKDLIKGIKEMEQKLIKDKEMMKNQGKILIGRDTRQSGQNLLEKFKKGVEYYKADILDVGFCTTPQGYCYVNIFNQHIQKGVKLNAQELNEIYINNNINQFNEIMQIMNEMNPQQEKKKVIFDCSHGIGYEVIKLFNQKGVNKYIDLKIINDTNCDQNDLNNGCGAEFIHKQQKPPKNTQNDDKYGVSIDGDADRILYFINDPKQFKLIDGDKMIALYAFGVNHILREVFQIKDKIDLVAVNTQYSDFGLADYLLDFNIETKTTPTGVKYTHHEAVSHDVSIYFEVNGHGTFMAKQEYLQKIKEKIDLNDKNQLLGWKILNFRNDLTGDAIFNFLQIEIFLKYLNLTYEDWFEKYKPKKSWTYKITVGKKEKLIVNEYQGIVEKPNDIQNFIDQLLKEYNYIKMRIFIRASGTEDCIRIHLEWIQNPKFDENERKQLQKRIDEYLLNHKELN